MRWFFALNQASGTFPAYAEMVKVAVHTARRHTTLIPHCLYDGAECDLTVWLRDRGVTVIPCRSQFYSALERLAARKGDQYYLTGGAGAFLRLEIPRVAREHGYPDAEALYTDCDVMFLRDVVPDLCAQTPRFFAVAPEGDPTDYRHPNTGVMLMNLSRLTQEDARFLPWTRWYLDTLARHEVDFVWDQSVYQLYYRPFSRLLLTRGVNDLWRRRLAHRLRRLDPPRWNRLPLSFNWKPYWGDAAAAQIVHFHGPKPNDPRCAAGEHPEALIRGLTGGSYLALSAAWRQALWEAG